MKTEAIALCSLVFFISYMLVAFVWPSLRTYRSSRVNPLTFGNTDNAHDFIGKWFKIIILFIPLMQVCYLSGEKVFQYILPINYLQSLFLQRVGGALCISSLIWTVIAQWQMGNSWRIGLDNENKTALVQKGLFSLSRNPIFAGMITTLLGLFFLLPNALTLLTLVCAYLLIQIQIRLEEEFLLQQHGEKYVAYCKKVKRFI